VASGRVHDLVTIASTIPLGIYVSEWTRDPFAGFCASVGCALGALIGPDLDQDKHARWPWRRYARAIPHRHVWSHLPLLGTALRLAYLLVLPVLVFNLFYPGLLMSPWSLFFLRWYGGWVFVGLATSDAEHWLFDRCPVRVGYGKPK
jgi:uncharacterized metal-binding protein